MCVVEFFKGLFNGGTTVESKMEVHQGRLGFYPCTYETYRKLKKLNYYCDLWYRAKRKHYYWSRKLPHNRVTWVLDTDSPTTTWKGIPLPEPKCCSFLDEHDVRACVANNYHLARMPSKRSEDVKHLSMSISDIDKLLHDIELWHQQ